MDYVKSDLERAGAMENNSKRETKLKTAARGRSERKVSREKEKRRRNDSNHDQTTRGEQQCVSVNIY